MFCIIDGGCKYGRWIIKGGSGILWKLEWVVVNHEIYLNP